MKLRINSPVDYSVTFITLVSISIYLIPSNIYYSILREKSFTVLYPEFVFYILFSLFSFLAGSFFGYRVKPPIVISKNSEDNSKASANAKRKLGKFAFFISLMLSSLYLLLILSAFPLNYLIKADNSIRESVWTYVSSMKIGFLLPSACAAYSVCVYYILLYQKNTTWKILAFITPLVLLFVCSYISQTKAIAIMALTIGLSPILIYYRIGKISWRLLSTIIVAVFSLILIYFVYSVLDRIYSINNGSVSNSFDSIKYIVVGYLFAGINKFAALFGGVLHLNSLSFWNLFAPVYNLPLIGSNIVDTFGDYGIQLRSISVDNWQSSFSEVASLGFNQGFNVLSIYGDLYGSFGWLSLYLFVLFGFISSRCWISYIEGGVFGVGMLPYILFSTVQWLVYNPFFSRDFLIFYFIQLLFFLLYIALKSNLERRYEKKYVNYT